MKVTTKAELLKAIKVLKRAHVEYHRAIEADTQPRLQKAGTIYFIAKAKLFKMAGV